MFFFFLQCHYFNNYILGKTCSFNPGYVTGGKAIIVGTENTEDDCAILVKRTEPTARGASWSVRGKTCWADFGNRFVSAVSVRENLRACFFEGTFSPIPIYILILFVLIYVFAKYLSVIVIIGDCSCRNHKLNGFGNCEGRNITIGSYTGPLCYVKEPTGCSDLQGPEKLRWSWEPCQSKGKIYTSITRHCNI